MSDADASTSLQAFARPTNDAAAELVATTVGLVSKAEFTRRREVLEHKADKKEGGETKKKKKLKTGKAGGGAVLSFDDEDGEEEEASGESLLKRPKLGKNPSVDSSFLPDKERDEALARRREKLAKEYKNGQDAIKAQLIEVTYSYHDPSGRDGFRGHRNTVTLPKGATMQEFLNKCREQQARPSMGSWSKTRVAKASADAHDVACLVSVRTGCAALLLCRGPNVCQGGPHNAARRHLLRAHPHQGQGQVGAALPL